MRRNACGPARVLAGLLLATCGAHATAAFAATDAWPQFRGAGARGIAEGQHLPDTWDVDTGTNVRWKTAIPGLGHASPVVARGCVLILTADSGEMDPELRLGLYGDIGSVAEEPPHEWRILCLSLANGRVLWQRTLHRGIPAIKRHTKASHANTTPATDGRHIVVFLGSEGLYCLDYCGNVLWKRDLGVLDSGYFRVPAAQWGFASSPIIHRGVVYVQCDVQQDSFLAAFDVRTGREIWRTPRDDVPTWGTPTIVNAPSGTQLVVNGYRHAGGYNPWTGAPIWQLGGGGDIPVPTPIFAHGLIYLSSAHGANRPLCAIRPSARGELTPPPSDAQPSADEPIAWYQPRAGIYMQTPLVYGDHLYACRLNGILSCFDASSGERLYQQRLGSGSSGFTASAVAADGKLYFTSEDGTVHVVAAGPAYREVAAVEMGEPCMATPAIAGGLLLIRTQHHVYAIGEPRPPTVVRARHRTRSGLFGRRTWLRARCRR